MQVVNLDKKLPSLQIWRLDIRAYRLLSLLFLVISALSFIYASQMHDRHSSQQARLLQLSNQKSLMQLEKSVEVAYGEQYSRIAQDYTQAADVRFEWADALRTISEMAGVSEVTHYSDARVEMLPLTDSEQRKSTSSADNAAMKLLNTNTIPLAKPLSNSAPRQSNLSVANFLYANKMKIGLNLKFEASLLPVLYRISTLQGFAVDLHACWVNRTGIKAELRLDCELAVLEVNV